MAHAGKRRSRASKTHSSSASTLKKVVHTDKAKGSAELSFDVPKGVPFSFAETGMQQSIEKVPQNSQGGPRPVQDAEQLMVEWDDFMAGYLEDHLLESLFNVFVKAIRQVVACGYSEKEAELAVLKSGLYYGILNPVMNIVNGALIFLEMVKDFGTSKYHIFENLGDLVEYLLVEMVYVLKEAKPSLTVAQAMWGLMVSDLDLAEAYAVDCRTLSAYSTLGNEMCEALFSYPKYSYLFQDSQSSTSSDQRELQSDSPHSMHSFGRVSYTGNENSVSDASSGRNSFYEYLNGVGDTLVSDEKDGSRKGRFVASKREMLRQKPSRLGRHYKDHMSTETLITKISTWVPMALDKRLKNPNSANSNTKRTCSKRSSVAGDNLPVAVHGTSYSARLPMENYMSALPAPRLEVNSPPSDIHIGTPYDNSSGEYVPRDEKDEMIRSLASRLLMLKKEHQHLTDWANEKVMQAAQRLRKDQAELMTLRQEKELVEKSEEGKQHIPKGNAVKRLSEMEYAVASSFNHVKMASSTASKLEEVNLVLKKEMEAAKLQTVESAAKLQGALMREQKALKRTQSCEGKKSLLREELSANKRKVAELQMALEKAKGLYSQIEARCKQEEKEKEKHLAKARSIARERERLESLAEKEELAVRQNAETELQKGKVHIKLLERTLFESKSSKLSQVRRNLKDKPSEDVCPKVGPKSVRMEWECVMCMTEEKSVVFLPCAHQSLCACCNRLHEKQGMKDCPSCRTPIKRRITVRFANP